MNNYHPCDVRHRSQIQVITDRILEIAERLVLAGAGVAAFMLAAKFLLF